MRICDPEILLDAATCFLCIGEEMLDAEQIYLLCQWANAF